MNGFSPRYSFLVNAEVDSMGGVVDSGVGIGTKPSPRRAAIEKAQAELRLEYDVLEERRRELEFLEKGGNPLDFKFGHAASVSVHSTSRTDQQLDQILISEAKGSFALTASPHGDSVESSGRLGVTTACEPNSADNFDGENEVLESERKHIHPGRASTVISEHSSQLDGSERVKESENSPIFRPKKDQAYRRRNRSRPNRDGLRSSYVDMASRGGHGPPLPSHQGKLSIPVISENQFELESDGTHAPLMPTNSRSSEFPERKLNVSTSKDKQDELQNGVKGEEAPVATSGAEADLAAGTENIVGVDVECPPCSNAEKTEDNATSLQLNESGGMNGDGKCMQTEGLLSNAVQTRKALDSDSSCSQTTLSVDANGNIDSESYTKLKDLDSNGIFKEHELSRGERSTGKDEKVLINNAIKSGSGYKEAQNSISHCGNCFANKNQEEIDKEISLPRDEVKDPSNVGEQKAVDHTETKSEKQAGLREDSIPIMESSCLVRLAASVDPFTHEIKRSDFSAASHVLQPPICDEGQQNLVDKAHEDRVLEEARIIEAKHKRIAELSVGSLPRECWQKSHWDFVLEEMAWLANDFAQERLWKMTAAAQICHWAGFASRSRSEKQKRCWMQKSIAHTLAKAVMEFWHSAQLLVENVDGSQSEKCIHVAKSNEVEAADCTVGGPDKDKAPEQKLRSCAWEQDLAVHGYAVRFLQFNCFATPLVKIEDAGIPEIESNTDLSDTSWPDQLTEENLFYVVPSGAMEIYRKSIELCLAETERTGNNMPEEVDTSMCDVASEFGYQLNGYEEDGGENVYYLPGAFDTGGPSKKKQKNMKSCAVRSYESGRDFGYNHCIENRNGATQSVLMGKRPSNSLHVDPIPTKRMRTASRPRVVGPYNAGHAGVAPALGRADVSSGDTSFQDDQSTLHGGFVVPRGSEADSAMDFEKHFIFDSTDVSAKPKKKKKIKHQGSTCDQRWQLVSAMQNDQKDHVRKRLGGYQLESNGNSGLFGQNAKKPKMMKQSLDSSFENLLPMSGSVASPVASQMSNMSSQSKIIKLIGGRDRSRKAKALKVPAGQPGPGSPWSLFEDQALVVLVHDMGPNWELVSDAINSTLQLKCIFRKPQECKERHKILMDTTSSDGADSADDSGSSQPYPSTLPGIPKGSARQLFQRLQGPMEEDAIKSHFEKIILIGQKLHLWKKQYDDQDLKQIAPVHGSHVVALSQVIPNNVNGGTLTPLDLCDAASNQDLLSLGYQAPHANGLALSNQGAIPSLHPPSGLNSSLQGLQGSSSLSVGNNLAASPQFNSPRSSGHRPGSFPVDEQQRIQQYSHTLAGRNIQPGSLPSSGALLGNDRGVHILPGGNGVGMMAGMNRSMPMPRPGHAGITSSILNSGTMMPSNMNMHSGAAPGHGNSMFRPCDALQMVQPGQSSDHQRQMMLPEMQMQGTQSNSSGVSPYGGLNSGYSTQASASPSVKTYLGHHQQQHPMPHQRSHVLSSPHLAHLPGSNQSSTPEQQVMLRLRERQIQQQRLLQRQQQQQQQRQHVQTPIQQLPVTSSVQNSSQIQSQASARPVSLPPMTHLSSQAQHQVKHQVSPHVPGRSAQSNAGGMMNQVGKQRQRQTQQQQQQSGRQHPQQRQLSESQQQAKVLKEMGRNNNMLMHPNVPMDSLHLNGISASPGAEVSEKDEQPVTLMQDQGLYSGSAGSAAPQSKSLLNPQTSNYSHSKKPFANTSTAMTKQVQQIPSHLDSSNQNQNTAVASASAPATSNQCVSVTAVPSPRHQQLHGQLKPSLKAVNQLQPALQRSIQQSHQVNSDPLTTSRSDHSAAEQQFANSTSKVDTSGVPTTSVDSVRVIPLSSSSTGVWNAQESLCDSVPSSSASSGPIGSSVLTNSLANEPLPSVSQGLRQRQLSSNMVPLSHSVGSQWQQQQSLLQQPSLQPMLPQKQSQQPLQQLEQSPQIVPQQLSQSQMQSEGGGVAGQ